MKRSDWLEVAALIRETWPAARFPQETIAAWWPLLADLPTSDLRRAVARLALDDRYPHGPRTAADLRQASEGPDRDWHDALAELTDVIRRRETGPCSCRFGEQSGVHETLCASVRPACPTFDDPDLTEVVDAYGWEHLRRADLSDTTFRAQWRDAYRAARRRRLDRTRERLALKVANTPALPGGGP